MVESETFVSRRRHPQGRRPRKLFTARGLVKDDDSTTIKEECEKKVGPVLGAMYNGFNAKCDAASPAVVPGACYAAPKELRLQGSTGNSKIFSSSLAFSIEDREIKDESLNDFTSNDLEKALQMSCMDGLLFSRAIDKNRDRNLAFQAEKDSNEISASAMPKVQKFIERLSPTQFDVTQFLPSRNNEHKSRSSGFACQMPYQNLRDQIAEDNIFHGNPMMYRPWNQERQFNLAMRDSAHSYALTDANNTTLGVDVPPSQIYVGDLPCLSEELIPVDDMPPVGSDINLTKLHPKPLVYRPDNVLNKAIFSVDSDDSDQDSCVSAESKKDKDSESPQTSKTFTNLKIIPTRPPCVLSSYIEDSAGPSFDHGEGIMVDQDENIECPSFERNTPLSFSAKATISTRQSCRRENELDEDRKSGNAASLEALHKVVSTSSLDVLNSHGGGMSVVVSIASDEAITFEKAKCVTPPFDDAYKQESSLSPKPSTREPISLFHDRFDSSYDSLPSQNENGGIAEDREEHDKKGEPCARKMIHEQQFNIHRGHSQSLRKPLNLMIGTKNVALTTSLTEDEFFSPRASPPSKPSSCSTRIGSLRYHQRNPASVGTGVVQSTPGFRFEEPFDEAEFFDSAMS